MSRLSAFAQIPSFRSPLLKSPPDSIPSIDELEQLQSELKLVKQRVSDRRRKASEDLKTIEESIRRMTEKEKGKSKAVDKIKRERDCMFYVNTDLNLFLILSCFLFMRYDCLHHEPAISHVLYPPFNYICQCPSSSVYSNIILNPQSCLWALPHFNVRLPNKMRGSNWLPDIGSYMDSSRIPKIFPVVGLRFLLEMTPGLQSRHFWTLMMVHHTSGVPLNHDIVRSHSVQWHPLRDRTSTHESCAFSLYIPWYFLNEQYRTLDDKKKKKKRKREAGDSDIEPGILILYFK